jgi:hypothetical protein
MKAEINRQATTKKDFIKNTSDMVMTANGELKFKGSNDSMPIEKTAHIQLATNAKIPFSYYERLLSKDPDVLAVNVNRWLETGNRDKMIRTLDGNVRAVLSARYKIIDNDLIANTVLDTLSTELGGTAEIKSSAITPGHMYIKIVSPKMEGEVRKGDAVQFGFSVSNSETGFGMVKITPLLYRLVCTNGLVISDPNYRGEDVRKRHIGRKNTIDADFNVIDDDYTEMKSSQVVETVRYNLINSLNQVRFDTLVDKLRNSTETKISVKDAPKIVELLGKTHGFSTTDNNNILNNLMADEDFTVYGVTNAITKYAHHDSLDYETATRFENVGWDVLNTPRFEWNSIAARAAEMNSVVDTLATV